MKQYIYKLSLSNAPLREIANPDRVHFYLCFNGKLLLTKLPLFIKRFGFSIELCKLFVKLLFKKNAVYFIVYNNHIVNDGVISFAYCKHYDINENDCVIGPVNTNINYHGKGFATLGLISCLYALKKDGRFQNAFIDTKENNYAMQKVINKCGFGEHTGEFERDEKYH